MSAISFFVVPTRIIADHSNSFASGNFRKFRKNRVTKFIALELLIGKEGRPSEILKIQVTENKKLCSI